jgi:hypothetical protein
MFRYRGCVAKKQKHKNIENAQQSFAKKKTKKKPCSNLGQACCYEQLGGIEYFGCRTNNGWSLSRWLFGGTQQSEIGDLFCVAQREHESCALRLRSAHNTTYL